MADNREYPNNREADTRDFDDVAMSELEGLSKKYGINASVPKQQPARPVSAPRNNRPAPAPRVVFEENEQGVPHARMVYDNTSRDIKSADGRRVVYAESEPRAPLRQRPQPVATSRRDPFSGMSSPTDETGMSRTFKKLYEEVRDEETGKSVPARPTSEARPKKRGFFATVFPAKGDSAKEVIRKLVMDLSAIVVIACIGYFVHDYIEHRNKVDQDDRIREGMVTESDIDAQWAKIRAKYPNINFPEGMNIKFAEIYAQNQDLVGWLTIPGTNIDTAVMHNPDDRYNGATEDYYLHHDIYGTENKYGISYMDMYNTGSALDTNNVIYGHNMTDGLMFAQLERYYSIDGFKAAPLIRYSTLFADYTFKVYAVIITNGEKYGDNDYLFDYTMTNFPSADNFGKFIQALDERKLYSTGVDINTNDTLITLSTCSYEISTDNMGRLAVVGRMVRPGESTDVDTSKAVVNNNVRYPQVWYDERGLENPFADAFRWTVNS